MTRDEESCLKTALAFVVLRKRLANDKRPGPGPPFVRGLMCHSIPTMPSLVDRTSHMDKMMRVAVSTALPLEDAKKVDHKSTQSTQSTLVTLDGIAGHLALQLRDDIVSNEWIQGSFQDFPNQIIAITTVWHRILLADPSVGAKLLPAIGRVLQDFYNDKVDEPSSEHCISVLFVKLLELVEAAVSMRLSDTNPLQLVEELSQAMGPELCLPIHTRDMAYFVLQQQRSGTKSPGVKILLRFFLYDLMEKLSACV
jgi:hypothetical protein